MSFDSTDWRLRMRNALKGALLLDGSDAGVPVEPVIEIIAQYNDAYLGIINSGGTAYMTSILQQLFMIPAFRTNMLTAPASAAASGPAEPEWPVGSFIGTHAEVLELRSAFRRLHDRVGMSDGRAMIDLKPYIATVMGDDGKPINSLVNDDAYQYLLRLLDRIENVEKAERKAAQLRAASSSSSASAGGSAAIASNPLPIERVLNTELLHQIIGAGGGCAHVRERKEPSLGGFSLAVKGHTSLEASLAHFITGEMLMARCDTCARRVDIVKRTVFDTLPAVLIFQLRRFELNFDTFQMEKLNVYFEIPILLNMKPYTAHANPLPANAKTTAPTAAGDSKFVPPPPPAEASTDPNHYMYELSGVVCHSGSATAGHYYSFVRERPIIGTNSGGGQWYEFNDAMVRPFDIRTLPNETFGGTDTRPPKSGKNKPEIFEKVRNGYVLIYDRVSTAPQSTATAATAAAAAVAAAALLPKQ